MKTSILVAIVLIGSYGVLLGYGQMEPATPIQTYWKKNRNTVATYLHANKASVVFTGSSLTAPLNFNEDAPCVYNFGLIGESALTGLDVIVMSAHNPHTVFVEINFPERDSNKYLISDASGFLARNFPEFIYTSPVNLVGARLSNFYYFLRDGRRQETKVTAPLEAEVVRKSEIALQREILNTPLSSILLATQISTFGAQVKNLEQKGVKVIFYEMPLNPELQNSNQAIQVRDAFRSAFPNNKFIGFAEMTKGATVKPADGLHLNVEDAKQVIVNLKGYYESVCEIDKAVQALPGL